jgi:hypothetical protein
VLRPMVLLFVLAAALALPTRGSAQVGGPRNHLGVGMVVDFGGEAEFGRFDEDDLDATIGLRAHLDHLIHKYVSIGGMVRMSWWEPEYVLAIDRSFLLDLAPRVVGHYDWRDFRFYGALAPGLTLSAIDDDGSRIDNPAVGFTLSLTVAGMEWWFSRRAGLFVELGWVGHWFEHDRGPGIADLDIGLSQGLFEFGFVFGV